MNNKSSIKFHLESEFSPQGDQPQAIARLTSAFKGGEKFQTLLGVTGSGKTFTMANVIANLGKKTLVLAHNKTLAAQLYAEFKEFFPNNAVEYFVSYYDYYQPEAYVVGSDTYIEKDASVNDEIDKLRHSATQSLLERDDVIVIASVSCIYGIGSPDEYASQKVSFFVGDVLDRDDFLKSLISIQFERNDMDFYRGKFRVRGDIVEVFPAHEDSKIIRIQFFGDEVESISLIDPLRGTTLTSLSRITIYPRSHYVVSEQKLKTAMQTIKEELRSRMAEFEKQNKLVEKQRIEQRTMLDLEMMEEMGYCSGIENYSRHLTGVPEGAPPPTLIDFFYKDFLIIIDESHITIPQVGGMFRGDRARKENLVNHGFRLPSALDNRPLNFNEFEERLDQVLFVSATPSEFELEKCQGEFIEQIIRPTGLVDPRIEVKKAENQVDDFYNEIRKTIKNGAKVLATTLTIRLAEDLSSYYSGLGLKVKYLHSEIETLERIEIIRDLRLGKFDVLIGINLLREGLDIPEVALVGIFDADKEGFLRSERSLIQTIGRAARNSEGKVILYARTTTKSMQKAIDETNRRRKIQEDYNTIHGITPTTIAKKISGGLIDTLRGPDSKKKASKKENVYLPKSPLELDKKIDELKKKMLSASKDLRFEEAAKLRDEIKSLNEFRMMI